MTAPALWSVIRATPPLAVLVVIGLWHGSLGLQVVIEDYITLGGGRNAAILVMRVAMASAGLASLWAVARIVL